MKVGDLVKRDANPSHYYQIIEIYDNQYRAKRLCLLNLTTGRYATDIQPSHVKVLS